MSGGFEPKPKLYQIIYGDGDWEGLAFTAKHMSTGAFLELQDMAEQMGTPPKATEVRKVMQRFGRQLVAWNLTRDGEPVPAVWALCLASGKPPLRDDPDHCDKHAGDEDACEWEGLAGLDLDLATDMFQRWSQAVAGVDPTSPEQSDGGGNSAAGQPPLLASASASLRNSSGPS